MSGSPEVRSLFLQEMAAHNLEPEPLEDGSYFLKLGGLTFTLNLENISKEYEADREPAHVKRFVETIFESLAPVPAWPEAASGLRLATEPGDYKFGEAIRESVSESLCRVLVHVGPEERRILWVTPAILEGWGQTREDAEKVASQNMADLLNRSELKTEDLDGHPFSYFTGATALRGWLIFCPNLKEAISPHLGWPIRAVVPCRDKLYLFAEEDDGILPHLAPAVVGMHRDSGYPVSTEVFRISDEGIEAIGKFQPAPEQDEEVVTEGLRMVEEDGVRFCIPEDWEEEHDEEGGAAFYPDDEDGGTLRLNVITLSSKSEAPIGAKSLADILEKRARELGTEVVQVPGGNALIFYREDHPEGDETGAFWCWEIVGVVPPRHARYAIFTYSVSADRTEAEDIVAYLELLKRELPLCRFLPAEGE
jgi:hypothetical protein